MFETCSVLILKIIPVAKTTEALCSTNSAGSTAAAAADYNSF